MKACFYGILILGAQCALADEKTPRMVEIEACFARATDAQIQTAIAVGGSSRPPNSLLLGNFPAGVMALQGVLSPDVSGNLFEKLKVAGAEIISIPRAITLSGRRAKLENVRELRYPSKFSPPSKESGKVIPTAFETKNVGITLEVDPTVGSDDYTIELMFNPRVVEFQGFIDYSEEKPGAAPPKPEAIPEMLRSPLKGGGVWQPVFSTREITTTVTLYDGQTLLISEQGTAPHVCILLTARILREK